MAGVKQPCPRDCPERSAECHGQCERYKAYQAEKMKQYEQNAQNAVIYADSKWKLDNCKNKALCKGHWHRSHGGG